MSVTVSGSRSCSPRRLDRAAVAETLAQVWPLAACVTEHPSIRPVPLEPVGLMLPPPEHHIPPGHVTLADVVRYLITEAGVEPRCPDWAHVLTANDG